MPRAGGLKGVGKDLGDTKEYFIYFITLFTAHIKRYSIKTMPLRILATCLGG